MTIEQFQLACEAEPFRPFVIHLADGREVSVVSKEFVLRMPSGRTVIVAQPDDSWNVIDMLLVTDLEFKSSKKRSRPDRN